MNDALNRLRSALQADAAFRHEARAASVHEMAAIAQRRGYDVSADDLRGVVRAARELSDDELDAVSGGGLAPAEIPPGAVLDALGVHAVAGLEDGSVSTAVNSFTLTDDSGLADWQGTDDEVSTSSTVIRGTSPRGG